METTKGEHSPDKCPSPTKSTRTSISEDHDPTSPQSQSKSPERMASPFKMSEPSVSPERPQGRKGSQSEKAAPDTRSTSPTDRTSPTKTSHPSSPEKSSRRGSVEKLSASLKDHSSPSKEASPDSSSRGGSPVKSSSSRPGSPMKSNGFGPKSPLKTDEFVPTSPDRGLPQSQTLSPERPPRKFKTSLKSPEDSIDSAMGFVEDADMTPSGASLTGSTGVLTEYYMTKPLTLELPPDGWYLKEAIDEKLFDPVMGLFTIPGADRLVSFEECVKIGITDDQSAEVVDPKSGRLASFTRAFDKSVGKYPDDSNPDRRLTMKEAITKKLIEFLKDRTEVIESEFAVKEGKLHPTGVKYKDKTGRNLSLTDAAKYGILGVAAVVGDPVIAGVAAAQAIKKGIKKIKKVDPKTGAEMIIEESVEIITDASPDDQ
ncbi:hypothetical protein Pcinc_014096 [Petrolisthes cinctipes]|uniref:Uncharacterized protein n=1 Tax=Petrolisthes cinctipes TaxID=88211 RepID=A0AAE1KTK4_PETCI|nr:hypothetical protein Pcinc_014096 [Petrolisthes cinctipes]